MERLRCGVVGVGQLGQHHVRIYRELPQAELVGIYDTDAARAGEIARTYDTLACGTLEQLLSKAQVLSLVVPTKLHHDIGKIILTRGRHVLIEKPITETPEQGRDLVNLARDRGVVLGTGHTERFAPALTTAMKWISKPRFIEALRMAGFGLRGTDVSVIHDLMIHDIDLVLSMVDSDIEKVEAIGVPVFTASADIANARLSFADGTIASLTASRVSIDRLRKMRFFQEDAYISVDFLKRDARIYKRKVNGEQLPAVATAGPSMKDLVEMVIPPIPDEEPLLLEIQDFLESIEEGRRPKVPGEAGVRALEVVSSIMEDMERRLAMWRSNA
jgi:predicted dehydrogenase